MGWLLSLTFAAIGDRRLRALFSAVVVGVSGDCRALVSAIVVGVGGDRQQLSDVVAGVGKLYYFRLRQWRLVLSAAAVGFGDDVDWFG